MIIYASEIIRQVTAVIQSEAIMQLNSNAGHQKSYQHYNKALEIYPKHYSSYYNLGFIYSEFLNEYTRGISYLKKSIAEDAIKEEPYYPRAYYYLGRTYERMEKPDSAIAYYTQAYRLNPL